MADQPEVVPFGERQFPLGVLGIDSLVAHEIRDAAAHSMFGLLGEPAPQHPELEAEASRLLRAYLHELENGEVSPTDGVHVPEVGQLSANVMVLGELEQLAGELAETGTLDSWGQFIAPPTAHGEAVGAAMGADGVARLYIASAWRRPAA
jgi:hypothetical protein